MEQVIGGQYLLQRLIGAGCFGEVYIAENTRTYDRVAVKLEKLRCSVPQLPWESKVYTLLSGGVGIPRLHWSGATDKHHAMVVALLGKSLEELFVSCHHRFSLKTVLMLTDQMLSRVEWIHNKNLIHRDIKPDNFVMGLGRKSNQVFIIDYGLAKSYRDSRTHVHIPYTEGKSLTGTARYASVGALRGVEQSRRDDLEALGFVWMYLLRGSLPWMGITAPNSKNKNAQICHIKARTSFQELCEGFPHEFVSYFEYVRKLRFNEKPDYATLRNGFRTLFIREGFTYDGKWDWNTRSPPAEAPPKPLLRSPQRISKPVVTIPSNARKF
jgi:serine/threonine protein kinase